MASPVDGRDLAWLGGRPEALRARYRRSKSQVRTMNKALSTKCAIKKTRSTKVPKRSLADQVSKLATSELTEDGRPLWRCYSNEGGHFSWDCPGLVEEEGDACDSCYEIAASLIEARRNKSRAFRPGWNAEIDAFVARTKAR